MTTASTEVPRYLAVPQIVTLDPAGVGGAMELLTGNITLLPGSSAPLKEGADMVNPSTTARRAVAGFALAAVVLIGSVGGFAGPAGAVKKPTPSSSVVGTYAMSVTVSNVTTPYTLSVRSDNTWVLIGGYLVEGIWSVSSGTYTFSQFYPSHCAIFSGILTRSGINTQTSPGPFNGCAGPGTWYAIRTKT